MYSRNVDTIAALDIIRKVRPNIKCVLIIFHAKTLIDNQLFLVRMQDS